MRTIFCQKDIKTLMNSIKGKQTSERIPVFKKELIIKYHQKEYDYISLLLREIDLKDLSFLKEELEIKIQNLINFEIERREITWTNIRSWIAIIVAIISVIFTIIYNLFLK
ncbi:MAG: hypothetical protein KKH98_09030 [Spirochaetes bacterium]|nr:hypothetical protein [Spirochaetota bacterium]